MEADEAESPRAVGIAGRRLESLLRCGRGARTCRGNPGGRRQGSECRANRRQGDHAMRTVEVGTATGPLADYVRQAQGGPLVITEDGAPTAVILPLPNTDWEGISLGTNPEFM